MYELLDMVNEIFICGSNLCACVYWVCGNVNKFCRIFMNRSNEIKNLLFVWPQGMVVFRIKGDNDLTEKLLKRLNYRGNIHCVPASLKGKYVIR